jgi:DNA topoisomerase-1
MAVDTEGDFAPVYEVSDGKKKVITELKKASKSAETIWIATDEDREGEAIGWHLLEVLKPKKDVKIHRIIFHEITKPALLHAIENPGDINMNVCKAQEARRVLDRLVGYTLSPLLWKKVARGLSAGRVQSVAVKIIVDRELEIRAFKPEEYWSLIALLNTDNKEMVEATLKKRDGKKVIPGSQVEMDEVLTDLKDASYTVVDVEEKEVTKNPSPPFTTSTLQQEAGRKLGFSLKQTMVVAQQLYEGIKLPGEGQTGLITYMRTDSVNLSEKAVTDAKQVIETEFGKEFALASPRVFKTKSKGAQQAHEAIRPTEMHRTADSLKGVLDAGQLKLYSLIWKRAVACQMAAAKLKRVGADIEASRYTFRATGQTVVFAGFLKVYQEGKDEGSAPTRKEEAGNNEKFLPQLTKGQVLTLEKLNPEQHFTKPPPRYTEASLVKKLEEEGIGRPSTYAPTISTIQNRGYIEKEGKQLKPLDVAFMVTELLSKHFPDIVSLSFTASMEDSLDGIETGKINSTEFLRDFYGPFAGSVAEKTESISRSEVQKERELGKDPDTGLTAIARFGRFGPYVQLGKVDELGKDDKPKSASLPKDVLLDDVTFDQAMALFVYPKELGEHNGDMLTVNLGRFGPYLKCGKTNASLGETEPGTVTFDEAVVILSTAAEQKKKAAEPLKILGEDPNTKGEIQVKTGRFGPYVTDGTTNMSIKKSLDPMEITLETAIEMLEAKRKRGPGRRGGFKKKKAAPKKKK